MADQSPTRLYAGLDVTGFADPDIVVALVDDHGPTAVEERGTTLRIFFAGAESRDAAAATVRELLPDATCTSVDVPDEQWAERSQASLTRIHVGGIIVAPPWDVPEATDATVITILPSMGFGTGHHASTRLCLGLLQALDMQGRSVCDVGTGSGVLAVAAHRLGAGMVTAVDYDHDSIVCARESAELNHVNERLTIAQVDLERTPHVDGAPFDIVLANLTGGLLRRLRDVLVGMTTAGGALILSGITAEERDDVVAAFVRDDVTMAEEQHEAGWVGLRLRR